MCFSLHVSQCIPCSIIPTCLRLQQDLAQPPLLPIYRYSIKSITHAAAIIIVALNVTLLDRTVSNTQMAFDPAFSVFCSSQARVHTCIYKQCSWVLITSYIGGSYIPFMYFWLVAISKHWANNVIFLQVNENINYHDKAVIQFSCFMVQDMVTLNEKD